MLLYLFLYLVFLTTVLILIHCSEKGGYFVVYHGVSIREVVSEAFNDI